MAARLLLPGLTPARDTPCGGRIAAVVYIKKTRFSSMAETGFSAVVSQALDAPVVLCLRSPLPEVTTIKVSCCLVLPARWSDVPAASKPIRHCTDVNHSSPGKGRGCADPSLNSSSHAWGFSIPGFPEKFLRGSKASTESLLLKSLKYGLKIAEEKWGVKKKLTVNILIILILLGAVLDAF